MNRKVNLLLLFVVAVTLAASGAMAQGTSQPAKKAGNNAPKKELRKPDIHYVPTPQEVVDEMLRMADVKKDDIIYDLGCGDGRIVITAAKRYGARGIGIDIDPERIKESEENARAAGVTDKVKFRLDDIFEADFKEATVVTLYLLDRLNEQLRPKLLRDLKPGTRIVSHAFRMGDWEPEKSAEVDGKMIYFWTIPAKKEQPK
jgi:cyclopropane fatty-acyl-phospholipid synthase-like methyltransferase